MIAAQPIASMPRPQATIGRLTVGLLAIAWLILSSPVPRSLRGTGMIVVLAIVALDIILGIGTRWLTFTPTSRLDERQAALRDDAYRTAFHWMRASLILLLILASVGAGMTAVQGYNPAGVTPRFLIAFVELLAILPTAVVAWQADSFSLSRDVSPAAPGRWWTLAVVPLLAGGWLIAAALLPARTFDQRETNILFEMSGATGCGQWLAEKEVAAGLGGAVGFHAEICWNGRQAFAVGDPSLGLPAGLLPHQEVDPNGPSLPNLTSCSPGSSETDFAVSSQACSEQIDADGTMTLTTRGHVSSGFGLSTRELQVQIIVNRDGKVLSVD